MNYFLKKVKEYINKEGLIPKESTVIVGFSAGPDSLALLYALNELKDELKTDIVAAHLNHGIRGKISDNEEENAKKIADALGIKYISKKITWDEKELSAGISEDRAREKRLEFFDEVTKSLNNENVYIATGHHLDDQLETVIIRLIQGAGIKGISGIAPKKGRYIRPLLCVTKDEINEYLKEIPYMPNMDNSNLSNDYLRNRIRHNVVPLLKAENPNISGTIASTTEIIRKENSYLENVAADSYIKVLKDNTLDIQKLEKLDIAIQNRVIRIWLFNNGINTADFNTVERITNLLKRKENGISADAGKDVLITKEYTCLVINKANRNKDLDTISSTYIPLEYIKVKYDEKVEKALRTGTFKAKDFPNLHITEEDYVLILKRDSALPVWRKRAAGDWYLYSQGKKKLKDFFIDKKIPKSNRDDYLVLAMDNQVLWIPGLLRAKYVNSLENNCQNDIIVIYKPKILA